jgi:predicted lipoprotein with Yx(FWY)xxD motif
MNPTDTIRTTKALSGLGAIALLIAACSGSGATTPKPSTAAATQPPATTAATASAAPSEDAEVYEVELGDTDTLGQFLVGEDGKTLYLFTPDSADKSVCNGDCAASWPPYVLEDGETVKAGEGVTGTFTTITRDDGSKQVAYAGHPLYYFAGDSAAGETNGQGLNSKWYVVGADGNAVMGGTSGKGTY